jgi:phosphonate transport system substrate-binding protein
MSHFCKIAALNRPQLRLCRFIPLVWFLIVAYTTAADTNSSTSVRFGFSRSMFLDTNENDTRAALKLHAAIIGASNNVVVSDSPGVFNNAAEIAEALARGSVDVVTTPAQDYPALPRELLSPRLLAAYVGDTYTEEYILFVRNDSGINTLADLRGRRLVVHNSLRGCLAPLWLDVLLAREGLETPANFFSRVRFANKPVRALLPVFFRQEEACVITRRSYNIMCELNPQLLKQLRALASSPQYIPQITCFRASLSPEIIDRIVRGSIATQNTVTGQQMLTIFQCDRITEVTSAELEGVIELIADQTRLRAETSVSAVKPEPLSRK